MTKKKQTKTTGVVIERKIAELDENPVREFLKSHVGVVYSRKNLAQKLNLSKSATHFFLTNSNYVRHCDPHEVGSGKDNLAVYTYCEHK